MEKRISYDQFQSVKRVAQACNPLIVKRDKIREKIEKLEAEYKDYDTQVASLEAGIKLVIGFRVEELVKKVIEPGVDANGQPKKTTKYLPTDIVSYDEDKKQFVITTPDTEEPSSEDERGCVPSEKDPSNENMCFQGDNVIEEDNHSGMEDPAQEPSNMQSGHVF